MTFLLIAALAFSTDAEGNAQPTQTGFDFTMAMKGLHGKGDLYAIIRTNMGDIIVRLAEHEAPNTVANFVGLARGTREWLDEKTGKWSKRPLYKGTICYRAVPGFMIECGDPEGTGRGGPGYVFADELTLKHDSPGTLSMANRGPNTNGSRFFITEVATPQLDGKHSVFGHVIKNLDLVSRIAHLQTGPGNRPENDVTIKYIEIFRSEKTPK